MFKYISIIAFITILAACTDGVSDTANGTQFGDADSNYVTINGNEFFYRDSGEGTPIILIHGWPLSSSLFDDNIPALAEEYRVIAPDLRGFSNSEMSGTPSEIRVEDYAQDVLALMDELEIEQAVIGGMSMGGPIVFAMHEQAPERFLGMLLINTIAANPFPQEEQLWLGWAENIEQNGVGVIPDQAMGDMLTGQTRMDNPGLVNHLSSMMENASDEGAIAGAYALANRSDFQPMLADITVPALIIVGLEDAIYPFEISQDMQENITDSELNILDGASHAAIIEAPEDANEAILNWMESMDMTNTTTGN